jgi:periplasmic protein CpxP/Spy
MKKLSLIIAVALGTLVAGNLAFAQDATKDTTKKGKGGFSPEQRMERISTQLNLTDDQKPKVKAVLEESSKQMQALRDLPQEERRPKMQTIREEETKKMKAILTEEQFKKYEETMQRASRRGGKKAEEKKSE